MDTEITIPTLPNPRAILDAIAKKKGEIGELKELLKLAEVQAIRRGLRADPAPSKDEGGAP